MWPVEDSPQLRPWALTLLSASQAPVGNGPPAGTVLSCGMNLGCREGEAHAPALTVNLVAILFCPLGLRQGPLSPPRASVLNQSLPNFQNSLGQSCRPTEGDPDRKGLKIRLESHLFLTGPPHLLFRAHSPPWGIGHESVLPGPTAVHTFLGSRLLRKNSPFS